MFISFTFFAGCKKNDAVVTFEKGTTYKETTIGRDFTITLGGAKLIIGIGGETFQADPNTGQVQ